MSNFSNNIEDLFIELNNQTAAHILGGSTDVSEPIAVNIIDNTQPQLTSNSLPLPGNYQAYGMTPFAPTLPATKLPRLNPIEPSPRTKPNVKNAINITIPLPLPVYS
ncbi:hypothetical protein B6N60_02574 [Richelia sinica FACHB-800]|uniref:Uncharacterized protein n=1 Tax=Richelia sinica FACHB-800 TaxID=1357546 RepID=A0A975Y557_9NOST|nr:hypothetical protein [Richelia sinica]MBD2666267.1 hypothetical protein [Richelia sinica FACHB-800]QXE23878.1 hypothetical protein B6N60_02574 [Richelia sinica FACHB-800]